ncbi:ribosome maturation factor RimM [Novacetimonas pomaceti]|uniref:ribosome maturation factor RimM n=1 Tax=Novacetimonas pomaceti TaxID=2021998 RepID=UPI001C2D65D7|nr:ribosome maturation factor RimM [Novacetimonas pomaceti]MBV1832860.1 ribosome maturation factor RimM [Novacetimonas pomaceti]
MDRDRILMGVVGRPHGVRGLVHVHSYAAVPEDLARYGAVRDEHGNVWHLSWRGKGIAELRDAAGQAIASREDAQGLVNRRLYVDRAELPEPEEDEFYVADLVGLHVIEQGTVPPRDLGQVRLVHDYGAGVSLEIVGPQGMILLPFTRACVPVVDMAARRIEVVLPDEIEVPAEFFPGDGAAESVA